MKLPYEPIARRPLESPLQRFVLGLIFGLTNLIFPLRYHGLERLPAEGPFVLICNHQSMFDVPVLLSKIRPWLYTMAKTELFRFPPLRRFLCWYGAFPVNRHKPEPSALKRALTLLRRGDAVGIFPEGTRIKRREPAGRGPYNKGAIYLAEKVGCPVVPVCINKPYRAFRLNHVYVGEPVSLRALEAELRECGAGTGPEDKIRILMERLYALPQSPGEVSHARSKLRVHTEKSAHRP